MDGWKNALYMDGWMDGWIDKVHYKLYGWMDGRTKCIIYGWMDGWMDG